MKELIKNALLLETNFQAELAILFIVMILLVLAIICLTIIKNQKNRGFMKSKFKIILWWSFLIIYLEIIYKFL